MNCAGAGALEEEAVVEVAGGLREAVPEHFGEDAARIRVGEVTRVFSISFVFQRGVLVSAGEQDVADEGAGFKIDSDEAGGERIEQLRI